MRNKAGNIKLLLIGDAGTGKSTLISSYISRHFPEDVPSVITDSIIPQDKTANSVILTIMDSSVRPGDREILRQKIRAADTILALFDTTRPDTLDNIVSEWLPFIHEVCEQDADEKRSKLTIGNCLSPPSSSELIMNNTVHTQEKIVSPVTVCKKSVAIIGTKKELLSDTENDIRERDEVAKVRQILKDFPFVHAYQRCSSKTLENVDNVFYLAELAVTFPLAPLYDCDMCDFTLPCKRAFRRIFRIADADQDGLLSDQELMALQSKCFDVPLSGNDIGAIKKQIQQSAKGAASTGVRASKLTLEGFLCFLEMFIEKFTPQVPWIILQSYGYDDELRLVVPPELSVNPMSIKRHHDRHVTELSVEATTFLKYIATQAIESTQSSSRPENITHGDNSSAGYISHEAFALIFSVLDPGLTHPWSDPPLFLPPSPGESDNLLILSGYPAGPGVGPVGTAITMDTWMMHWTQLAMHSPSTVKALLYLLGYTGRSNVGISDTLVVRHDHYAPSNIPGTSSVDPAKRLSLKLCILGPNGAGKASLVCSLSGAEQLSWGECDLPDQGPGNESPPWTPDRSVARLSSLESMVSHVSTESMNGSADAADDRRGYSSEYHGSTEYIISPQAGKSARPLLSDAGKMSPPASPLRRALTAPTGRWRRRGLKTCVTCAGQFFHTPYDNIKSTSATIMSASTMFQNPVILVPTAVPEIYACPWLARHGQSCDVVLLVFEFGSIDSFNSAMRLEKLVPDQVPRMYVATKGDVEIRSGDAAAAACAETATNYISLCQLPPLLVVSSTTGEGITSLQRALLDVASRPWTGIPAEIRRKRENQVNQRYATGALLFLGVGLTVAFVAHKYRK